MSLAPLRVAGRAVIAGALLGGCMTASVDNSLATPERLAALGTVEHGLLVEMECAQAKHGACWTSRLRGRAGVTPQEPGEAAVAIEQRQKHEGLAEAEAASCSGLPPIDRDSSPYAHPEDILRVARLDGGKAGAGVAIVFRGVPGMTPDRLSRLLDCAAARAAAMMSTAPELPNGPLIAGPGHTRVTASDEGLVVTTLTEDPTLAVALWRRSLRLVAR